MDGFVVQTITEQVDALAMTWRFGVRNSDSHVRLLSAELLVLCQPPWCNFSYPRRSPAGLIELFIVTEH
jgi:hypothetical protein